MKERTEIDKTILIEDLVQQIPGSVRYMMVHGIKCLACGEPIWGTLETASKGKGFSDEQIDAFIRDLDALARQEGFQYGAAVQFGTRGIDQ